MIHRLGTENNVLCLAMCRTLYRATHKMAAEHKQLMYDKEARGYFVVPLRANGPDPFAVII